MALRWVLQLGHTLVTSTENEEHMRTDVDVFDWELDAADMETLERLDSSRGDPTLMCVL